MSILSVAQDVSMYIGIDRPTAFLASDAQELRELASIANRAKDYICDGFDWQELTKEHTVTGDGSATSFDLPSDFSKFTDDAKGEACIQTAIMVGPMVRIRDLDTWLAMDVREIGRVTYSWIIYGGKLHIKPALPNLTQAKFFYQSKNSVKPAATPLVTKEVFNIDSDSFCLDERMLMLCMTWMWRHSKQQSYAEYKAEFGKRQSERITANRGPRSITFSRSRPMTGVETAYPFAIS